MSKPREFAHLIKKQFGSADNINSIPSKSPKVNNFMLSVHCLHKIIRSNMQ